MRMLTRWTILTLIMSPLAWAADLTADEQAVWELEEAYWVYVKNQDIDGYLTLWDDSFVGWPSFSKSPMGKESIAVWIPPLHANPTLSYDYELKRMAVRSFGDVVVAHYLVHDFHRSAETGEIVTNNRPYRITHTWQKRNGTWRIITGMSGSLVEDD